MSLLALPRELLPMIAADPACVRAIAWTCREMAAAMPRKLFVRVKGGMLVRSEYYTCRYRFLTLEEFTDMWTKLPPSVERRGLPGFSQLYPIIISNCTRWELEMAPVAAESWEGLLPAPAGYKKFRYARTFVGKGAAKGAKKDLYRQVADDYAAGNRSAMLVARQSLYYGDIVLFGSVETIHALAELVAQACAVYICT